MPDILKIITKYRLARNWTKYQLSEESSVPQSTISSWYKKDLTPSLASLDKICQAFDITISQFLAEENEPTFLTPSQKVLLEKWNCLTSGNRRAFLVLMDSIIEENKKHSR